jgi:hypothetical protein
VRATLWKELALEQACLAVVGMRGLRLLWIGALFFG